MKLDLNCQKEKFLSLCCQHDYDLLTGVKTMNLQDFERLTYLIMVLGYSSYQQFIERQYLEFYCILAEQAEREANILIEYPEYYEDENMLDKPNQWIENFLSHIPIENQAYYRNQIKENLTTE